jgi:hypothetical protein
VEGDRAGCGLGSGSEKDVRRDADPDCRLPLWFLGDSGGTLRMGWPEPCCGSYGAVCLSSSSHKASNTWLEYALFFTKLFDTLQRKLRSSYSRQ